MDDDAVFAQFAIEFAALSADPRPLRLSISPLDAWILLSQIQLALRHPANTGQSAERARQIARFLQSSVAADGALATVAERGWDAAYDVPATTAPDDAARQAQQAATLAQRFQALLGAGGGDAGS